MNVYLQSPLDYVVLFILTIVIIIGVYQFYFWCQRNNLRRPVEIKTFVDDWFPLLPGWIWIYSGIYYPLIVFMIFTFRDMRHFNYTAMSFFILLFIQMLFFVFFPVRTPAPWREAVTGSSTTRRFMRYVQKFDKSNNCFPSMHVSVATLTAYHLKMNIAGVGNWIFLFPLVIAVSALFTKQHYFVDLLPGAFLGWLCFKIFILIYP